MAPSIVTSDTTTRQIASIHTSASLELLMDSASPSDLSALSALTLQDDSPSPARLYLGATSPNNGSDALGTTRQHTPESSELSESVFVDVSSVMDTTAVDENSAALSPNPSLLSPALKISPRGSQSKSRRPRVVAKTGDSSSLRRRSASSGEQSLTSQDSIDFVTVPSRHASVTATGNGRYSLRGQSPVDTSNWTIIGPDVSHFDRMTKRKAEGPAGSASPSKRAKTTSPPPGSEEGTAEEVVVEDVVSETQPTSPVKVVPFVEKAAVIEEREGIIKFWAVNNDNKRESSIILTGLKCIFQKQLPKMPKDYIARLVYDRTHISLAIVKEPFQVVGGITYRPFPGRQFAEIVFCAISSEQQVKGYGAHLMAHLKDFVRAQSDVMHFLTYADNYAIGYFKKQGFSKEITLDKSIWMGYIKDYEGGTLMHCAMLPKIRYLEVPRMLQKQKEAVMAKIRAHSRSYDIHQPPKEWKNGAFPIDPMSIPAIKASGWSPDMDALARAPRHGPNYNQLLHLLNDMQNNSNAWPFQQPVNKDEVADYYDVIKEPMDLATMEEKHEKDLYPTPEDFIKDARLIYQNCRKYNNETTPYAKAANRLEKFMWQKIKEVPEWSHLEPSSF